MRYIKLIIVTVLVAAIGGAVVMWRRAGAEPGPTVAITSPGDTLGLAGTLALTVDGLGSGITRLDVSLVQNGRSTPLYSLAPRAAEGMVTVNQPIGKKTQPDLVNGPAQVTVTASRTVLFGLRSVTSTATRDFTVRLEPPRISVVSTHHFVNLGGAEFVVLRVTPEDAEAGVRVGDATYRAYRGAGAGLAAPALRVAFFALRYDQELGTAVMAFARDSAGNESTAAVDHKPFAKRFLASRIPIDQGFLDRVVPAIASNTPGLDVDVSTPAGRLNAFLVMNGDLRRKNAETIAAESNRTRPEILWKDAFAQMGNSQVESRFADQRTYINNGQEIDHQVHLGFDLATVQHAPVHAANDGIVVFASYLGIYGNCIIVDHGMGVQSLYGHLSSLAVQPGDRVTMGQEMGRTGTTGLAGGDHLHFTMLVQGTPVNSVEWWDPHWMEDRVWRKIREAGGTH